MRITNQLRTDKSIQYMNSSLEQLNKLHERVSTQKQFQNTSDNPYAASLSMSLKSSLQTLDDYTSTANLAGDWLSANEMAFQKMEDLAIRADVLITRAANDTMGADERKNAIKPEIDSILAQVVDLANTQHNGQYIFSGYKTDTKTYGYDPATNALTPIAAPAAPEQIQRTLEPGKNVTLNFMGTTVFDSFLQTLQTIQTALDGNDGDTLRSALDTLQSSLSKINNARTQNGARLRQVDITSDFLEKSKIETKSLLSKNEDINLAEGISLLTNQQTTYQVVLEVSQRAISTMNLFDYMQ